MDKPRELSIEELRVATPAQRAAYLAELARASLQANMQRHAAEQRAATDPEPGK